MFRVMARKNGIPFSDNVDCLSAAVMAEGYTGADVERIMLKASSVARKAGRDVVTDEDLSHAMHAVRINTKDRNTMIQTALAVVSDLDLLPPYYRELAEQQIEAKTAQPLELVQPTRQARSL